MFLHNLLNVLVQITNKIGLQKKILLQAEPGSQEYKNIIGVIAVPRVRLAVEPWVIVRLLCGVTAVVFRPNVTSVALLSYRALRTIITLCHILIFPAALDIFSSSYFSYFIRPSDKARQQTDTLLSSRRKKQQYL
jgi:hypothetical protein